MKPELSPGRGVRKAGRPDSAGSTSMAMRRSASEPISQSASAIMSAAKATGSAWKLPPEITSPSAAKTSGLSETPFASVSRVAAAWRRRSRQAPITCGWQRRQYGSWMRSSSTRCEARMALPRIRSRSAAATSIWPRWRRSSWMRASNGPSEPRAASVASAPVTSAPWNTRSASKRPASASAAETFLRGKLDRREARAGERLARRQPRAVEKELALADERGGEMRERREIARRPDRALPRHDRDEPALEAGEEMGQRRPAHPGGALAEIGDLERHRQAHDRRRQRLADPGGVRQHELALQLREILVRDAHRGELSEAGVDAVDRRVLRQDRVDRRGPGLDRGAAALVEQDGRAEIDCAPIGERHRAGAEEDGWRHRACPQGRALRAPSPRLRGEGWGEGLGDFALPSPLTRSLSRVGLSPQAGRGESALALTLPSTRARAAGRGRSRRRSRRDARCPRLRGRTTCRARACRSHPRARAPWRPRG